jgi:hypothetical protein
MIDSELLKGGEHMEEKIMQLANFNITFGEKKEPMLSHFKDIIYPAFIGDYKRGKDSEFPQFLFSDVKVIEYKDGELALVGNYVKETQYTVYTTMKGREITSSPGKFPTAPYSRFIVFLKNHRMILVKNEPTSPDVRSFQSTVRHIFNRYIRDTNKNRDTSALLPHAIVNIVDIPLKEDIEAILKGVKKINWVKLRFFPLNNDLDPSPMATAFRKQMSEVASDTGNAIFNTPESKQGVQDMLEESVGLAIATMRVENENGETDTIKENSFSSNIKIPFSKNITSEDDNHLISSATKFDVINVTSPENKSYYKKYIGVIRALMS